MIVKIADLEEEATFSGKVEPKEFEGLCEDVDFITPIDYALKIQRAGARFKVEGHVHCIIGIPCARCLERFFYDIESNVQLVLVSKEMAPKDIELELEKEELDTHYYEGEELDLNEILQEEIVLNIPMRAVCKEDCKGLCERCGGNRNLGECKCENQRNTRLGDLLKSFLNMEGEGYGSTEEKAVKVKKR